MPVSSTQRSLLAIVVAASTLVSASAARASNGPPSVWAIEAASEQCVVWQGLLTKEVALACEALDGSCKVSESASELPDFRVFLQCVSADEWTLEARTRNGVTLWETKVTGEVDERLRSAALQIARDPVPERTAADVMLRATLPDHDYVRPKRPHRDAQLALSTTAGFAASSSSPGVAGGMSWGIGLRGLLAAPGSWISDFSRPYLSLAVDGGGEGAAKHFNGRSGAGIGFGAPWDKSYLGFSAEMGPAIVSYMAYRSTTSTGYFATTELVYFAQASVYLQLATESYVRPYVALSSAIFSGQRDVPRLRGALELGLTWGAL